MLVSIKTYEIEMEIKGIHRYLPCYIIVVLYNPAHVNYDALYMLRSIFQFFKKKKLKSESESTHTPEEGTQ